MHGKRDATNSTDMLDGMQACDDMAQVIYSVLPEDVKWPREYIFNEAEHWSVPYGGAGARGRRDARCDLAACSHELQGKQDRSRVDRRRRRERGSKKDGKPRSPVPGKPSPVQSPRRPDRWRVEHSSCSVENTAQSTGTWPQPSPVSTTPRLEIDDDKAGPCLADFSSSTQRKRPARMLGYSGRFLLCMRQ
ncbi:hypothetical protein AOLI_G00221960 [Acnodon oligacanthus]